jgi:hypothetical protein
MRTDDKVWRVSLPKMMLEQSLTRDMHIYEC